jgi:hypothetical protein
LNQLPRVNSAKYFESKAGNIDAAISNGRKNDTSKEDLDGLDKRRDSSRIYSF